MGKNKISKFADMKTYPNVFEYTFRYNDEQTCEMQGKWNESFFHNENPIVLELGCGRGEYTVGLARQNPEKNFIGIDIKGARMWTGATEALQEGLTNVAFLRTNIELIHRFFSPREVNELWITFPDPQMKKYTKRLTSTPFLERYARILQPNGIIHLKTDSPFLYTYTDALVKCNGLPAEVNTANLYGKLSPEEEALTKEARSIQTYYESQWLGRGLDIKYIRFRLPEGKALQEPDIEIELDSYRSYNRDKRSSINSRPAAKK
ncbi:MAG: tRNA (guanosine(46)-N7)-methyltransferase TrmB [Bacteroidaceae bacterium]|nr:tRNA (guanosine(46)-N7)-methyltransferase TrmB [Bacteroidaceae bacterium]